MGQAAIEKKATLRELLTQQPKVELHFEDMTMKASAQAKSQMDGIHQTQEGCKKCKTITTL
jgi:hypothetical protein